jgi:hypothetical protein
MPDDIEAELIMGGFSSGRRNRHARRCESWHRVEMAHLRRHHLLRPGTVTVLSWTNRGRPTGSIGYRACADRIELHYTCNDESVRQEISFTHTPTNFDGWRKRFECPRCWRPCDVLYGGRRFFCRKCWRLTYQSQYDQWWERARSRAEKIRTKLGQPGFITPYDFDRFPDKPKWMRWATYERLKSEDAQLMRACSAGLLSVTQTLRKRIGG